MTTLITGAGLIGSLVADLLARRGRPVILSDIRPLASNGVTGISHVQCDVADIDALEALVKKFDVTEIVHTAAVLSTGMRADPRAGLRTNFLAITNVLEIARSETNQARGQRQFAYDPLFQFRHTARPAD